MGQVVGQNTASDQGLRTLFATHAAVFDTSTGSKLNLQILEWLYIGIGEEQYLIILLKYFIQYSIKTCGTHYKSLPEALLMRAHKYIFMENY